MKLRVFTPDFMAWYNAPHIKLTVLGADRDTDTLFPDNPHVVYVAVNTVLPMIFPTLLISYPYIVINDVNCTSCDMFNSMESPTVDTHHVRSILLIVLPIVSHTSTMYPVCSLEVQAHVSSVQNPLSLYHHLLSFFTGWLIGILNLWDMS